MKPKATTVTHTWLSLNAHHTFCRIISTGVPKQTVVFDFTLGFLNHTAGIIDYLMAHLQPTLNKFWTNKHTDRQTYTPTYNVFRGPGWRFRRHCHASPSSTINCIPPWYTCTRTRVHVRVHVHVYVYSSMMYVHVYYSY